MMETSHPVLTVGHSTHSADAFISLLRQHDVTALADVRSAPYSRVNPQFNRETLAGSLNASGIKYVFLGRELGARSEDPSCYENGRVIYERLGRTELFVSGIQRVIRGTAGYRIALVCAEGDPLRCHRSILVAPALTALGAMVQHILPNGRLEAHNVTMERLLDIHRLPHEDLLRSKDELIAEALARQEQRIAYVDDRIASVSSRAAQ